MANLWDFFLNRNKQPEQPQPRPRIALSLADFPQQAQPTRNFSDLFARTETEIPPRIQLAPPMQTAQVADTPQPASRIDLASPTMRAANRYANAPASTFEPSMGENPYGQNEPVTIPSQLSLGETPTAATAGPFTASSYTPNPESAMPPMPSPEEQRMQSERARLASLTDPNNRPENNDRGAWGRVWDVVREAIISGGQAWDRNAGVQDPWARLAASAGGSIAGGLTGGFDPSIDERRKRQRDIGESRIRLGEYEKQADADVRRQNVQADNEYQRARLGEMGADRVRKQETATADRAARAKTRIVGLKRFNPKDPTHASLAKEAGLDPKELQGWDDRNPIEKQVAGVTYRMNRTTGAYEPTNLPTDEAKTLTDYEVTMPNGEKRQYRVAQKDAANFSTQMSTLGIRLDHQSQENQKQRAFTAGQNAIRNAQEAAETINAIRKHGLKLGETEETIQQMVDKFTGTLPDTVRKQMK